MEGCWSLSALRTRWPSERPNRRLHLSDCTPDNAQSSFTLSVEN